uniref:(+)-epi-alpha-bisabolol synthase n=1 Tax=Phyla dulcis TaxID=542674 RepID=TPS8_PHYDL|nr:RecName: Full=(+)-epi-alpha-bisabolol synthase; AltName: Full=Terpene synthase 8; Short=LdTPS8 [Phyla dulcis]AFR23372.1 (+)-epi-alpha-bisabolol synthase [Phyla dulcis]
MNSTSRRSANYKPTIWNNEYLQSLNSIYGEKRFLEQAEKLKDEVRMLLEKTSDPLDHIELVDVLQRLAISYHFTEYIDRNLKNIYDILIDGRRWNHADNLHATTLSFRLLRQHGYQVSPEVFRNFMDETGNFKKNLCDDIKGLLSLYEASYLLTEGETIMDSAQAFATHHLKQKLEENMNKNLGDEIAHALELPLHWRVPKLDVRWSIDAYERRQDMNPLLLELAKLDFNIAQSMYQDELKELSRWYSKTHLPEKLAFARDRLVESYLWGLGLASEPHHKYCRMMVAQSTTLISIIDDIYDVYGTLDELQLFTHAVDRWDIKYLEQLPEYMQICFLALFNTVNERSYDFLLDKGFNVIPHSSYRWAELCKTYLIEANWYHSGYKPSLNEYLNQGLISVAGPHALSHTYLCMTDSLKEKHILDLRTNPPVIKWVSILVRLADDLGTSTDELKRGDNPKSIQCHMHDTGCNEEETRAYIKNLIGSTWKKINKDVLMNFEYSMDFRTAAMNGARVSQFMYQYDDDGHGVPEGKSKERVCSLIVEPIPLP